MSLTVRTLDHVNVRTSNLDAMIAWYGAMLDMHPGVRPDFSFPGAWLYAGDRAVIHLVGVDAPPEPGDSLTLEHFALGATGLPALLDRAEAAGEKVVVREVPGFPLIQVNMWDPDGNHIHIDFDSAEHQAV